MSQSPQEAPRTEDQGVNEVIESVADLDQHPLSDHHDQLSRAHEQLHDALHQPADQSDRTGGERPS